MKQAFCLMMISAALATAQTSSPRRYTVILEDPPVAERYSVRGGTQLAEANNYRVQIERRQETLKAELKTRNIQVTGSVSLLVNAVFVVAPPERVEEINNLPGVKGVVPQRRYKLDLNAAVNLVNAPAAWTALGGTANAGAGVKIAVLDTGIDQKHPAFQDSSLNVPAGYPKCTRGDCAYTNSKVIVARSYVSYLAAGSDPANPALDSRPDDLSARDRLGHGTAVASAAAGNVNTGAVTFNGVAPKAWLGNYKVYGSPQLNDTTTDQILLQALQDAVSDGMDIINFSSGGPSFTGPLDTGAACGLRTGAPCDPVAVAFENLSAEGVLAISSAGNSGYDGNYAPTFHTVGSPANAPSVVAVGATTNSHSFLPQVRAENGSAPSNLKTIAATSGDSPLSVGAITANVVDVSVFGSPLGCAGYNLGALAGSIALIERGTCTFATKAGNAWNAGAVGVIFYMADSSAISSLNWGGVSQIGIPAVMISLADATALKAFLSTSGGQVSIDAAAAEVTSSNSNLLTYYSSLGPTTGTLALKPDLVATGGSVYMATQKLDPLGDMYSASGYGVADGTSFASPIVAGAAALVKQKHPTWSPAQLRSALVNNASAGINFNEDGVSVDVQSTGGGKLDAGAAVGASITASPASLSFGALAAVPQSVSFTLTNGGSAAVTLALAVTPSSNRTGATFTLDQTTLTLAAGASATVKATLSGAIPAAGTYNGTVTITGGATLRIPYLYLVGANVVDNLIPLTGDGWDTGVGQQITDGIVAFRLIDPYGVPVANVPVTWSGSATIRNADAVTDANGIAAAEGYVGNVPGTYSITARAGGLGYTFSGNARSLPTVATGGVVNGATFDASQPIAPGSYITIYGSGLSDYSDVNGFATLPLSIDYVHVTFDVPSAGISVPGRIVFVSPGQINVQVPWELQGQSSVQVKVGVQNTDSNVVTVNVADVSPGFFENSGVAAALNGSTYAVITAANPIGRGQVALLYANGLGPVTNQPATGEAALATQLPQLKSPATVTIGGANAPVGFGGLAPGFSGLYQLNVTIPSSLAPGTYPMTVTVNGVTSKASNISIN